MREKILIALALACLCIPTPPELLGESYGGMHYCSKGAYFSKGRGDESAPRKYAPSREVDIIHQRLEVTPDFERRSVAGVIQIDFKPIARPFGELLLDAVDLLVSRVESSVAVQGWQNTGTEVVVTFKEPVAPDAATWVRVTYKAEEPAHGLYFRTPAMGYKTGDMHLWTQGEMHEARHWFPSYDYPNEKFTTEMVCHVKEGMVALSNGRLVSQKADPATGLVAWHWLQDKPHVNYLVTLCAGYFQKVEDRYGDLPLAFWTPPSQIAQARNSFAGTKEMMKFFEEETGVKYPWARYDQVVVDDFSWGGMENTTQTTLVDGTLFPDELAGTRSSTSLVAHELAHQWFGDYVTSKDWSHIWLNEGFATYYDALFHEHYKGHDEFLYEMLGNARGVLGQQNDIIPIVYRAYKNPVEQFGFRAYPKGSWILHMLRTQLGPDLYRKCVKTHLERNALGVATTEELVGVIEELSGRDWDQFFDQYVYHAHHPELRVSYSWEERTQMARVSVQQVQKLGPTVLMFKVPLKIRFKSGSSVHDVVAQVSGASEDFHFTVPFKPSIVRVDPDYGLLAQIEFSPSTEMLHAQLADKSDMIGRVLAVEQLGKKRDKGSIEKLQHTLNNDPFWGVRVEAARQLRQIHDEDSRTALLASTTQTDARVRREVVQGIASFFRAETPAALAKAVEGEKNPDVQAVVVRALSAYPSDLVREQLLGYLRSTSYRQIIADAAVDAIRGQADVACLEPLMNVLRQREAEFTTGGFADGLNTLAVLAAEQENKSAVREFIAARLSHPKRRIQSTAIEALGRLGDPQAIPALQTFADAGKESPNKQAAENAIRRIRERKPQSAEVGTLRNEVMELQKANKEMKQQFEEMKKRFERESSAPAKTSPSPKKKGLFGGGGK